jgi:4-amino-4-deoxy-L-arabinose transferase-like glycosyltransferase
VAWLAKFHYGPVMVLSVCVVWFASLRRWRAFLHLANPVGLVVAAAAVVVWPYLVLRQLPQAWAVWQTETVGRAVGELGREPVWFYLPEVFVQLAPWSLLLPLAAARSWRLAWGQAGVAVPSDEVRRERFLWVWFGTQFLVLSASAFKHHHYLMAALPAVALILGRTLAEVAAEFRDGRRVFSRRVAASWILAAVFAGGVAYAVVSRRWPHLGPPTLVMAVCLSVGTTVAAACLSRRQWTASVAAAGFTFVGCYVAVMGWIFPGRDSRLPVGRFADDVRREHPQDAVCVFGLKEVPVVYYLAEPVFRLEERDRLAERLRDDGRLVVVAEARLVGSLAELGTCRELATVTDHPDCPPSKEEPLALFELTRRVRVAER